MKKKIITFMLALALVLPCVLALSACSSSKHSHTYEHGLCSCGNYKGTTLNQSDGAQITFEKIDANETVYGRFQVDVAVHYSYLVGTALDGEDYEIKFYARYNNASTKSVVFRQLDIPKSFAGSDYYYFNTLPVDGYVYVDFTNKSEEAVTYYPVSVYSATHSYAVDKGEVTATTAIDIDAEFTVGESYCYKYTLGAGSYLIYMKADFVDFPNIYDSENNLINDSLISAGGNFTLVVEEEMTIFAHFFCNSNEDADDSHFTIRKQL